MNIINSIEKSKSLEQKFRDALCLKFSDPPSSFFKKKALLNFTECLTSNNRAKTRYKIKVLLSSRNRNIFDFIYKKTIN